MNRPDIDLVFGRGRLRMATGSHAEVFREASQPWEDRRYSKRFLVSEAGDLRHWTEREARILARLAGFDIASVPRLAPREPGPESSPEWVRTRDAGVTVDHWATLLPVQRDGTPWRHVFEDCAHWWALARHCLVALEALHEQGLVHLDLKADNVCIPVGPADFDPTVPGAVLAPRFEQLALIDFAFSLLPGEDLGQPLPIAGHAEFDYQSPRLLKALEAGRQGDLAPTRQLDWRCDLYSLAAMLGRYLPPPEGAWTPWHLEQAQALIRQLREAHDAEDPAQRPHRALITLAKHALADAHLSASLRRGWMLADGAPTASPDLATPLTRIVPPAGSGSPRKEPEQKAAGARPAQERPAQVRPAPVRTPPARAPARRTARAPGWFAVLVVGAVLGAGWWAMEPRMASERDADAALRAAADALHAPAVLPPPKATPKKEELPAELPPLAAAEPAPEPVEPAASVVQPVVQPVIQPEAPAASAVAAAASEVAPALQASAPAPAPAPARGKAPVRTRVATSSKPVPRPIPKPSAAAPAARAAVDDAERKRVLEWLDRRGPAPRSDMKLPPAPGTEPSSAAPPSKAASPP